MAEDLHSIKLAASSGAVIPLPDVFSNFSGKRYRENDSREPFLQIKLRPWPLQALVVEIWSHSHGQAGTQAQASSSSSNPYTGFDLAPIRNLHEPGSDRAPEFYEISRTAPSDSKKAPSDLNRSVCSGFVWCRGGPPTQDTCDAADWLDSLGDTSEIRLGVFPKAKGADTVNSVFQMVVQAYYTTGNGYYEISQIDKSLDALESDLEKLAPGDPLRSKPLEKLINAHLQRYAMLMRPADIGPLMRYLTEYTRDRPSNPSNALGGFHEIARLVECHFDLEAEPPDMARAVALFNGVVKAMFGPHSGSPKIPVSVDQPLPTSTDARSALRQAVLKAQAALDATTEGSITHTRETYILAEQRSRLFQQDGSLDTLHQSIKLCKQALDDISTADPFYAMMVNLYAGCLNTRHIWTGSLDDLQEARAKMVALINHHTNHKKPLFSQAYMTLHDCYISDYKANPGNLDGLSEAISMAEISIKKTRRSDEGLPSALGKIAYALITRYETAAKKVDDIDRAIQYVEDALTLVSDPDLLTRLGSCLALKFERDQELDDINRAIEKTTKAVEETPENHVNRGYRVGCLASLYGLRFNKKRKEEDRKTEISLNVQSLNCSSWTPVSRILSARSAANLCADSGDWKQASKILAKAVALFPLLSSQAVLDKDTQTILPQISGFASYAAASALEAGEDAAVVLPRLELGRGALINRLIDMRADITDLTRDHPELANLFNTLRETLDRPFTAAQGQPIVSSQRRFELNQEMEDVIRRIRKKDGYERFLLPQTEEEIKSTASQGPLIVVNVCPWRCDAFIVTQDGGIKLKELPDLTVEELEKRHGGKRGRLRDPNLMKYLWYSLCLPCLSFLGFDKPLEDNWRRVWWILTNGADRLPIHAAGIHEAGSREMVLDRVISSYATSIKALQYSRQKASKWPEDTTALESKNALLVSVPDKVGKYKPLENVKEEMKAVKKGCRDLSLDVAEPKANKSEVLARIADCRLLHFSGHGDSMRNPSDSRLVLKDCETSPLTVADMRQNFFQDRRPFLAFLSACSTGENQGAHLSDEGLHLMGAMQLAGFRHVIGTLWEIKDRPCIKVAETFYATLKRHGMTDGAVALGLHLAMRRLRDGDAEGHTKGAQDVAVGGQIVWTDGSSVTSNTVLDWWFPYVHLGA